MKRSSSIIAPAAVAAAALLLTSGCSTQVNNATRDTGIPFVSPVFRLGTNINIAPLDELSAAPHRDGVPVVSAKGEIVRAVFTRQEASDASSPGHRPARSLVGFVSIPESASRSWSPDMRTSVCAVDAGQWKSALEAFDTVYEQLVISCQHDELTVRKVNTLEALDTVYEQLVISGQHDELNGRTVAVPEPGGTQNGRVVVSKAGTRSPEVTRGAPGHRSAR